jgi:hypothetical protein
MHLLTCSVDIFVFVTKHTGHRLVAHSALAWTPAYAPCSTCCAVVLLSNAFCVLSDVHYIRLSTANITLVSVHHQPHLCMVVDHPWQLITTSLHAGWPSSLLVACLVAFLHNSAVCVHASVHGHVQQLPIY